MQIRYPYPHLAKAIYLQAVEIKAGKTFNDGFTKGLEYFAKLNPSKTKTTLVYGGSGQQKVGKHQVVGWNGLDQIEIR